MWIAGYGSSGSHRTYQVVFKGSVAGLSTGANVSFNGIKVGEVTHLTFSRSDPHQVVADIDVNSEAPIDTNTRARLETQGLTGGAVVALLGGVTAGSPLVATMARPPVIYAGQSIQLQDILDSVAALSTKATTVLDDADKIIADNSPTIHSALANVDQFSKALADNSAGVDAALKSVGELGKQIGPLAARLQTLSDDADRLVQSIDPDQVRAIVGQRPGYVGEGCFGHRSRRQASFRQFRFDPFDASERRRLRQDLGRQRAQYRRDAEKPGRDQQDRAAGRGANPELSENADRVLEAVDPDKVSAVSTTCRPSARLSPRARTM